MPEFITQNTISQFDFQQVNLEIQGFCEEYAVPAKKLFAIQLILEELVTNIIKYGGGDGKKEMIEVSLSLIGEDVRLVIRDNSGAFDPLRSILPDVSLPAEERNIGGLGLFLVRKKVKSLLYENKDGFNIVIATI